MGGEAGGTGTTPGSQGLGPKQRATNDPLSLATFSCADVNGRSFGERSEIEFPTLRFAKPIADIRNPLPGIYLLLPRIPSYHFPPGEYSLDVGMNLDGRGIFYRPGLLRPGLSDPEVDDPFLTSFRDLLGGDLLLTCAFQESD